MAVVSQIVTPSRPASHREQRLARDLKLERELHDKTLRALEAAHRRLVLVESVLDSLDTAFAQITGMSPDEFLKKY